MTHTCIGLCAFDENLWLRSREVEIFHLKILNIYCQQIVLTFIYRLVATALSFIGLMEIWYCKTFFFSSRVVTYIKHANLVSVNRRTSLSMLFLWKSLRSPLKKVCNSIDSIARTCGECTQTTQSNTRLEEKSASRLHTCEIA